MRITMFAAALVLAAGAVGCGSKEKAAAPKDVPAPVAKPTTKPPVPTPAPVTPPAPVIAPVPVIDPKAAWMPAPRDPDAVDDSGDPAPAPAAPIDPAALAAQRADKRLPCPKGEALAAIGRSLFATDDKVTATCLPAQHDRALWVIHATQQSAEDDDDLIALVDATTKATLGKEGTDFQASQSWIADLDGDGRDEVLDEVSSTEHQEGMTVLAVYGLAGDRPTALGRLVTGATGVIPPDGNSAGPLRCASKVKLVARPDHGVRVELQTTTNAAPPAYCPFRGRHLYDWTGTDFVERLETARLRPQIACPTGATLAEQARQAFEVSSGPGVKHTATCVPVRSARNLWLFEGSVVTQGTGGAAAVESHVRALVDPELRVSAWSAGIGEVVPLGATAARAPRKRTVIDLDGDGRDEILDELVEVTGDVTTRRLAVASLGRAEQIAASGWLKLGGASAAAGWSCESTLAIVPGPDGSQQLDVTATVTGDATACPPAGHQVYRWDGGALVAAAPKGP